MLMNQGQGGDALQQLGRTIEAIHRAEVGAARAVLTILDGQPRCWDCGANVKRGDFSCPNCGSMGDRIAADFR